MKWGCKVNNLIDRKDGYTVVELLVVVSVASLILLPVLNSLITGNWLQKKSFNQVFMQQGAQQILNQLIEGKGLTGGLRTAKTVVYSESMLAFVTINDPEASTVYSNITYQLQDNKLYYTEKPMAAIVPVAVYTNWSAAPVLSDVSVFSVTYGKSGNNAFAISFRLSRHLNDGGTNSFSVSTEVKPRRF